MGGFDENQKKQSPSQSAIKTKLKILLLIVATSVLTIYLFSGSSMNHIHLWDSENLIQKLNSTQSQLASAQSQLLDLQHRLKTSNSLLETLLQELGRAHGDKSQPDSRDGWPDELEGELKLAVGPHKLPFGYTSNLASDELYPSLGSSCRKFQDELAQYMSYEIGRECPSDDVFAQRLLLKGCEPLPRRRCHPRSPKKYAGPVPFPDSLWTIPPDTSINWDPYTCKNYTCLVNRGNAKGSYDCKDCFDLGGREKSRWMFDTDSILFGIDAILGLKPKGTIRIGLDIGGGSGTFAARMRERNVTIVTSTMNFDGPFNSFIASRGLISMHISVANRLPFFDNTLDIVHSMHVLSNWIPDMMLEFALYDIYVGVCARIVRAMGISKR